MTVELQQAYRDLLVIIGHRPQHHSRRADRFPCLCGAAEPVMSRTLRRARAAAIDPAHGRADPSSFTAPVLGGPDSATTTAASTNDAAITKKATRNPAVSMITPSAMVQIEPTP